MKDEIIKFFHPHFSRLKVVEDHAGFRMFGLKNGRQYCYDFPRDFDKQLRFPVEEIFKHILILFQRNGL